MVDLSFILEQAKVTVLFYPHRGVGTISVLLAVSSQGNITKSMGACPSDRLAFHSWIVERSYLNSTAGI